jgi:signal transduction histidine kinase
MGRIVEGLLLIARGENQQLSLDRKPFDVVDVVREVKEITVAMAEGRNVTVRAESSGPVQVLGDPTRVRQILLNLASNAIRYTSEGSVTFTLARADAMAKVAVVDTGCGIAPEHLDRIFDRFHRVGHSRSKAHGGTGLGLTIAQMLARLQDGRIEVESEVGRGSEFALWLPVVELE